MRIDEADLVLTETELAGVTALLRPPAGRLALTPQAALDPAEQARVSAAYQAMPQPARTLLDTVVGALASPARLGDLHYTVADEQVSRQVLAWPAPPAEQLAFLARNGDEWRAGTRSTTQLQALIREVLAAGDSLRREPFSLALTTQAVITLLGVLDQLRYARLYSQLTHQAPITSFAPAEVLARVQESKTEDFRWPLLFVEKVMPVDFTAALTLPDVVDGLRELAQAKLVEGTEDSGDSPLYSLTAEGEVVAQAVLHEVSKAALAISEIAPDGQMGTDVMLFVRGSLNLFLFTMSGEAGAVVAMDGEQLETFLQGALAPPSPEAVDAAAPAPELQAAPAATLAPADETMAPAPSVPAWVLQVVEGEKAGQRFPLAAEVTIGRQQGCEVVLEEPSVSRRHARIRPEGSGYLLEDLGSRNGTFVNGQRIAAATAVRPGDQIRIGDRVVLTISSSSSAPAVEAPAEQTVMPRAAKIPVPPAPAAASVCPHCGAAARPGLRFCEQCGGKLAAR